jgi:hypothetical protein
MEIRVEMCQHYSWEGKPVCAKGHKASLKCHVEREDCKDYEPSKYHSERREDNDCK